MLITILTPTYNRSNLLPELYESLLRQTSKDFEWLIVDDGSSDNTKEVLKRMSQGSIFPVRYFYKRNGGKHTAVNMGVKNAGGQLVLILDSDDELPPTAIADIAEAYKPIKGRQEFAGVCGYMAHRDGQVIGLPLVEVEASEIVLRYKYNVCGDMCEVFRTDVLREFPFPEIKDERFCPECLVWNRIARKYRLHVFPKVVYLRDYLDGGLTSNIVRIRMNSPIATMMTYAEMLDYDIPWVEKVKAAINFWRFQACLTAEHAREVNAAIPNVSFVWYWAKPLGLLMHRRDVKRNK